MKAALAIFVKTPELSPVKTRLAAQIGPEQALLAYERCVQHLEFKALELQKCLSFSLDLFWAVAEVQALEHKRWQNFFRLSQGTGDLGQRLNHVYEDLIRSYDMVVFMGADSPLFPLSEVVQSLEWLGQTPQGAVFGPTEDGGYYLFAARRPIPSTSWTSVTYSTATTLAEFKRHFTTGWELNELNPHWDLDTKEDLQKILSIAPDFLAPIELLPK